MTNSRMIYGAASLLFAAVAAGWDIKIRRIPNLLTAAALVTGLMLHLLCDGWKGMLASLIAAVIAGAIFLLFFIAGGMGGGDVKLIAAIACITGLQWTGYLLIFTSLVGGAMALVLAVARGSLFRTLANMFSLLRHHLALGLTPHPELNVENRATLRLPYAMAIAAGSFLTFYLQKVQG
ncbi:prepilin peptidase CpaA [Silvibacterium bohemicum]|uniref:Prepilin peptidase CpaA n=1 Tax=Silvibacterium bohemicum TaxID=1577686 RepID=A0A841JMN9_9BACT|nr:prepilin peptidase [Silvibacterium bohemicum]MBB6142642.1 prepilin peptidase CpaA [Silvibacterium bohemicum]